MKSEFWKNEENEQRHHDDDCLQMKLVKVWREKKEVDEEVKKKDVSKCGPFKVSRMRTRRG